MRTATALTRLILALLMVGVTVAMIQHLVVRQLTGLQIGNVQLEHAEGSLLNGFAFSQLDTPWLSVWLNVQWQWCPGFSPWRWCWRADGNGIRGEGKLQLGLGQLTVTQSQISVEQKAVRLHRLVQSQLTADMAIEQLVWRFDRTLPERIQARALVTDSTVMEYQIRPLQLEITRPAADTDLTVEWQGEDMTGQMVVDAKGRYQLQNRLTPLPPLAQLLTQFFKPQQPGVFELQDRGQLTGGKS